MRIFMVVLILVSIMTLAGQAATAVVAVVSLAPELGGAPKVAI